MPLPQLWKSAVDERLWMFVQLRHPQGLTASSAGGPTFVELVPVGSGPAALAGCQLPTVLIRDYLRKNNKVKRDLGLV